MKNSLRQLFRTPGKTALFFLLSGVMALLLVVSLELWISTNKKISAVEDNFITLGTVQQEGADTFPQIELWSAGINYVSDPSNVDYETLDKTAGYKEWFFPALEKPQEDIVPVEALDFPEADYILGPEKRPYYGTWYPDAKVPLDDTVIASVWEFTPLETAEAGIPFQAQITRVLTGNPSLEGNDSIYVCDHFNKEPKPLETGKTYVGCVFPSPAVYTHKNTEELVYEYSLLPYPQTDHPNAVSDYYAEVTDGFYETELGKSWMALAEALERKKYTYPVLPTDGLMLLPTFHNGQANVKLGREISREEFESGARVCIVSMDFLLAQELEIGDKIPLSLYYADHRFAPRMEFGGGDWMPVSYMNLVNENGGAYPAFWEEEYEIVGAYHSPSVYSAAHDEIELSLHLFIIPAKSVKASDEGSISEAGPMLHTTASFIIPNGTTAAFLQNLHKNVPEAAKLEIGFDDGGYSRIISNLVKMRTTSILLFFIALAVALTVLMLMLYFFIIKQARRSAVEASLGMTKRQCRVSLVSGIMAICVAGTLLGAIAGLYSTSKSEAYLSGEPEPIFSTEYSNWVREEVADISSEEETDSNALPVIRALLTAVALQGLTASSAIVFVNRNLNIDPILLINGKE